MMKALAIALICAAVTAFSTPALAEGDWIMELVDATQQDFNTVKGNFRAAYTTGYGSWEDYGEATGFSLAEVEKRIVTRRGILAALETSDDSSDSHTRGLVKMVVHDLDQINLSLLALIHDDRGYAGYIRTADDELVSGVSGWQEGIRQSLIEVKRCARMVRTVKAQAGSDLLSPEAAATIN